MELLYVQDYYCCRKALLSVQAGGQSLYTSGQLELIPATSEFPEVVEATRFPGRYQRFRHH